MSDLADVEPPEERPFFNERGVHVTTRRFINGAYSIVLDDVQITYVRREIPHTGLALLGAIIFGVLTPFAIIPAAFYSAMGTTPAGAIWAIVFAFLALRCLSRAFRTKKFTLELHTAQEVNRSLVSTDEGFIDRVHAAIADARSTHPHPGQIL